LACESLLTVLSVIHQPRYDSFCAFHQVILLGPKGSGTVYHGPPEDAVTYFSSIGYTCPATCNPADFMIDILMDKMEVESCSSTCVSSEELSLHWRTARCASLSIPTQEVIPEVCSTKLVASWVVVGLFATFTSLILFFFDGTANIIASPDLGWKAAPSSALLIGLPCNGYGNAPDAGSKLMGFCLVLHTTVLLVLAGYCTWRWVRSRDSALYTEFLFGMCCGPVFVVFGWLPSLCRPANQSATSPSNSASQHQAPKHKMRAQVYGALACCLIWAGLIFAHVTMSSLAQLVQCDSQAIQSQFAPLAAEWQAACEVSESMIKTGLFNPLEGYICETFESKHIFHGHEEREQFFDVALSLYPSILCFAVLVALTAFSSIQQLHRIQLTSAKPRIATASGQFLLYLQRAALLKMRGWVALLVDVVLSCILGLVVGFLSSKTYLPGLIYTNTTIPFGPGSISAPELREHCFDTSELAKVANLVKACSMTVIALQDPYQMAALGAGMGLALLALSAALPVLSSNIALFERESWTGVSTVGYLCSHVLIHFLGVILGSGVFSITAYIFLSQNVALSLGSLFLAALLAQVGSAALGILISTIASKETALVIGVLVVLINWFMCGLPIPYNSMPLLGKVASNLSLLRYSVEHLYIEMTGGMSSTFPGMKEANMLVPGWHVSDASSVWSLCLLMQIFYTVLYIVLSNVVWSMFRK